MNKVLQTLGLAMRAGKVVTGEEQVLKEIKSRRSHLVLLAKDAAHNTEKRVTDKCKTYHIPITRCFTRDELGRAVGKEERVVIAITEVGFAKRMLKGVYDDKKDAGV